MADLMEKIVSLCKRRGFVYPTSEIYGGLVSSYDYGPAGVVLLRNIRNAWWRELVESRADMVGIDTQIVLHPRTWEASGHVQNFSEPLVEDTVTHKRYRLDHLIPDSENMTLEEMKQYAKENDLKSPDGNELSQPKEFNLLFKTSIGAVQGEKSDVYLRGETAQGIFTNFKNIVDSSRVKLPFGVGQIGKSFRNEITTGQFIFRTLEFEQAEIEYFFDPEKTSWEALMESWKKAMWDFATKSLGIREENLRWRRHTDKERSHYSRDTYDLDYKFPFGWKELWGIAYRTDYDLNQHSKLSGQDLTYRDPEDNRVITPHVIEPAVGINRLFFMTMTDAYYEDGERVVLGFKAKIAPTQVAIFPLVRNKPEVVKYAREIFESLRVTDLRVDWDERGNIGKRYLAQDEIGTPWCVTVDYQTLEDNSVTVRDRDTTRQDRVNVDKLEEYFKSKLV